MVIKSVGVLGAGVMGRSIAQALALTAHEVAVVDISPRALDAARQALVKDIRQHMMLRPDAGREDPTVIKGRVRFSTNLHDLGNVDYLIESITENWELKRAAFVRLDGICKRSCVFASNTSAIPIVRMASQTSRPDRFIGLHFMNPVTLKHTVEMVRTEEVSAEPIETTMQFLR